MPVAARDQTMRSTDIPDWAESCPDGLFIATLDNTYLYLNAAVERIMGVSRDELRRDPRSYLKMLHPEDRERHIRELAARAEGQRQEAQSYVYRIMSGERTRLILARIWLLSEDGPQAGLITDITDQVCASMVIQHELDGCDREEFKVLTAREREVVTHLVRNSSSEQIAARLGISEKTVRSHLRSIYARLGVSGQRELLLKLSVYRWHCPSA